MSRSVAVGNKFRYQDQIYEVVEITREGTAHTDFLSQMNLGEAVGVARIVKRTNRARKIVRVPLRKISSGVNRLKKELIKNCS